ncbi:MAG: ABC transporter permease [Gammaproteobacteria bacterium]|nr:ABC transporter permease [Gammaproteobacteria bacterium]
MNLNQQFIAFKTIVTKEILRFARIWLQTIVPPVITTGLYFVIFGQLIGSQLSNIAGYSYIDYIIPGIILMSIINNSYANVVASFYMSKFSHFIEEMIVSPMPNYLILTGYVIGGVARGLAVGLVVAIISTFFAELNVHSYVILFSVVILTAILFSLGGFINAIYANSFDDISIIPTFVLIPLTYLGGIFYSIDMLPAFWQTVSLGNPILYMVNAMRYGMLGVSDIDLVTAFSIIILFVVALFSFCLYLLNSGKGIRS